MPEVTAHQGLFRSTKLHIEDTGGDGRPVVLVHGWPLSGQAWSRQVPALAEAGHRVVTYDRRGFGRSAHPARGYDYDTLADDLYAVLAELELAEVTLIGSSMGAGEVVRLCARHHAERVQSVVLASTITPRLLRCAENPEGSLTIEQVDRWTTQITRDLPGFYDQLAEAMFSADGELTVTDEQLAHTRELCNRADPGAVLGCLHAIATTDFRADLARLTVPALVIHGAADRLVPFVSSGARTVTALPDSRLHLIGGAPHGCHVSHAEEFNAALLSFLAVPV